MVMSEAEILYKCRINGATKHYLNVLADLNCCTVNAIEKILKADGWIKSGRSFIPPKQSIPKNHFEEKQFEPGSFKGSVLSESVYGDIESYSKLIRKSAATGKLESAVVEYVHDHYAEGITFMDVADHFECALWLVTDIILKNQAINGSIFDNKSQETDTYVYNSIITALRKRVLN